MKRDILKSAEICLPNLNCEARSNIIAETFVGYKAWNMIMGGILW